MTPLGLFVTGTDTGVGKTRVSTGLCRAYVQWGRRVAAMKPVASGCERTSAGLRNEDALALMAAMNVAADYADVNPVAFEPPIAPHIAADLAGVAIDFTRLDRAQERLREQSDVLIVEGAGGWLVPLDAERSFADLAARWRLDVVLVVGMRLGCLNHALLSAESIARRGLRLVGWVANCIDPGLLYPAENIAALRTRMTAPCLAVLPFTPADDGSLAARALACSTVLRSPR